jgi:hypothetical protein
MDRKGSTLLNIDFPYLTEARQGYMDFFNPSYTNKTPLILADGTSVQFPADWTDEDADKWRKSMDLQRPDGFVGRTFTN